MPKIINGLGFMTIAQFALIAVLSLSMAIFTSIGKCSEHNNMSANAHKEYHSVKSSS